MPNWRDYLSSLVSPAGTATGTGPLPSQPQGAGARPILPLDVTAYTYLGSPDFGTGPYGYGVYGSGPYGGTIVGINLNIVTLGPQQPRVNWFPTSIISFCPSPLPTQFTAYRNFISPNSVVIPTSPGNDNSWSRDLSLSNGETIIGVWTGGEAGIQATMRLMGTRTVPGGYRT